MTIPYRMTSTSITLVVEGETHVITSDSHRNYTAIREAIKTKNWDEIPSLVNFAQEVIDFGEGHVKIVDGVVSVNGRVLNNTLTKRILEQMAEGFDIKPMALFLENLVLNPSKRALDEMYDWMEASDMPITDDGHLLAYKRVRQDYMDIYSGTISNVIGAKPSMPRNMVDEEKGRTCSQGLHFCSQNYLFNFAISNPNTDRILIVKINPKNVVAIPEDYQNAKGRCCEYEVIGEVDRSNVKFYEKSVHPMSSFNHDAYNDDDEGDSLDSHTSDDEEYWVISHHQDNWIDGTKRRVVEKEFADLDDAIHYAKSILADSDIKLVTVEKDEYQEVFKMTKEEFESKWSSVEEEGTPPRDTFVSVQQAMSILGVDVIKLNEMLDEGTKVERVVVDGDPKIRLKV